MPQIVPRPASAPAQPLWPRSQVSATKFLGLVGGLGNIRRFYAMSKLFGNGLDTMSLLIYSRRD